MLDTLSAHWHADTDHGDLDGPGCHCREHARRALPLLASAWEDGRIAGLQAASNPLAIRLNPALATGNPYHREEGR